MKIPPRLKIGGHEYKVVLTKDDGVLEGATGCMSNDQLTIWIDSRCPQSIQEVTLLHEILHATSTTLSDGELGHAVIDALSEQLYQVLKDNQLLK